MSQAEEMDSKKLENVPFVEVGNETLEVSAEDANIGSKRSMAGLNAVAKKPKVDAKSLVYKLVSCKTFTRELAQMLWGR